MTAEGSLLTGSFELSLWPILYTVETPGLLPLEKLSGTTGQGQRLFWPPFYLKMGRWPVSSRKDGTCP